MGNWLHKDEELKKIMARHNDADNETKSVADTKAELIPHLKSNPCYARLPRHIIGELEKATTFHTFNRALGKIYDYADENRIWLGFMP